MFGAFGGGGAGGNGGAGGGGFFSSLAGLFGFGGKQHGGPVYAGRPVVVGEAGPELFVPTRGGSIVPNHAMGGINIRIEGRAAPAERRAQLQLAKQTALQTQRALKRNG